MELRIRLNEKDYVFWDIKEMIATLFTIPTYYQHSSLDALKQNYITCCDLVIEICDQLKPEAKDANNKTLRAHFTRLKTRMNIMKTAMAAITSRNAAITAFYDATLAFSGMSRLAGFGFISRHGDIIKGNAEKDSVTSR